MKYRISAIIASVLVSLLATAQPKTVFEQMEARFEKGVYPTKFVNVPYRIARFGGEKQGKTSLVVVLHNSSLAGENNVSQLRMRALRSTVRYMDKSGMKAFLLVPQCRKDRWWNESYATNGEAMPAIMKHLIDHVVQNERIDGDIYILGVSTGAAGVWQMASEYTDLCSAILVAGAYPNRISPSKVRRTPQCVVIAEEDKMAGADQVTPFVEKLRKNGEVRYVIAPGKAIYEVDECGFTDDNLDWVFSHHKK